MQDSTTSQTPQKKPDFESIKQTDSRGNESWAARQLMPLLDYVKWENFEIVIKRAQQAATNSGAPLENHFLEVRKMVSVGYGNDRSIRDYRLSRYACYLIAQNGDPRKPAIAAAQTYFATQTRRQEIGDRALKRLEARRRLSKTEKRFSQVMRRRKISSRGMAEIRSAGDQGLFGGRDTFEMKQIYDIEDHKPLADVMPTVGIRAKDLATEMTTVNTERRNLRGKGPIKEEHIGNNAGVRDTLEKRGIYLEDMPAEEDTKKIARRIESKRRKLEKEQD